MPKQTIQCSCQCLVQDVEASDRYVLAGPTSLPLLGNKDRPSLTNQAGKSVSPLTSSHIVLRIVLHAHGKAFIQKAAKLSGPGAFKFGCLYTAAHHASSLLGKLISHVSTLSFACRHIWLLFFLPFFFSY